jgi:ECF transporter S component (folate family)
MKKRISQTKRGFSPWLIAICAMLAAMSIVCGKFLAIPLGDVIRISFENLPIFLASLMFGPVAGGVTAVVADVFGCFLRGYALNPIITLGALVIGLISGIIFRLMKRFGTASKAAVGVLVSHVIGSVIIKTFGLAAFYSMPFPTLLLWRGLNYLIVAALDLTVIILIAKNKYVSAIINEANSLKAKSLK